MAELTLVCIVAGGVSRPARLLSIKMLPAARDRSAAAQQALACSGHAASGAPLKSNGSRH